MDAEKLKEITRVNPELLDRDSLIELAILCRHIAAMAIDAMSQHKNIISESLEREPDLDKCRRTLGLFNLKRDKLIDIIAANFDLNMMAETSVAQEMLNAWPTMPGE